MDQKVLAFIKNHRISCLTTVLKNGQPYGSTLHFCNSEEPLEFYFLTEKGSKKTTGLPGKASLVIGFDEKEMITMQFEGEASITDENERQVAMKIFQKKFGMDTSKLDENDIFLKFTPNWWHYLEVRSNPKILITSES